VTTGIHPPPDPGQAGVHPPAKATQTDTPVADDSVIPAEAGIQEPADTNQPDITAAADPSVIPVKTGIHLPSDAVQALTASAARGRQLAHLLDSDTPVPGVTTGDLRPKIAAIAVPSTTDDRNMTDDDFALTAGWGHYGSGEAVMPGQGRAIERAYTAKERDALKNAPPAATNAERDALSGLSGARRNPEAPGDSAQSPTKSPVNPAAKPTPDTGNTSAILGETTYDIYLNDRAYWQNVPANVWRYKLGGYQVLKKWLSYREQTVLARPLKLEEVQHFYDTARRIGAILMLTNETEYTER
jgi:hypothetical protein